jgi:hypothetical protein
MWALGVAAGYQIHADSNFDFEKSVSNAEILSAVDTACKSQPSGNVFWAVETNLDRLFNKPHSLVR